mmetsp:Transcript_1113/g.2836  ORF Transcript_1113/g.2836 Transcript_1113/m.2836 type:complete len:254 (+) Transcript_1113:472-1233(+)
MVLEAGANGRAQHDAEADRVHDVVHVDERGQQVHVDEGGLHQDGLPHGPDGLVRLLHARHEEPVGRRLHGRDPPVVCHAADVRGDPDPHHAGRIVHAPYDCNLLVFEDVEPVHRQPATRPLLAGKLRVDPQAVVHLLHRVPPLLLARERLYLQGHAQEPPGDGRVAQDPLPLLLGHAQGEELHLHAADGVVELQEALRALEPAVHGGGEEETQEQTHEYSQEHSYLLEFAGPQLRRIRQKDQQHKGADDAEQQ